MYAVVRLQMEMSERMSKRSDGWWTDCLDWLTYIEMLNYNSLIMAVTSFSQNITDNGLI